LLFMEKEQTQQCSIPIHKPKLREYIFFFSSGILISLPFASFFESLYPTSFSMALLIIVIAPIIEELAKVFPLFYRHGETERSIVTLGLLIGIGFGIAELTGYVIIGVPLLARIPGVIFHASSATITAYGVAKKNPLPYYLTAVFLHIANNFFALTAESYSFFMVLLVLYSAYVLAWRYWRRARKDVIVV